MSLYSAAAFALIIAIALATVSFYRPDRVFKRSAIAVVGAVALPYVAAFALEPFLGSGAGLGVALILYVLSGFILLGAVSASLGAAARYVWTALGSSND